MGLVLSGVQPTGNLHLGNYLGALKQWVDIQNEQDCFFMLADLHAITVHQEPSELRESIYKTAALYIACGIDPKKSAIFNQSRVSGHSELAWILGCNTPLGWLSRMTQFKDKASGNKSDIYDLVKLLKRYIEAIKDSKDINDQAIEMLSNIHKINARVVKLDLNSSETLNFYNEVQESIYKARKNLNDVSVNINLGFEGILESVVAVEEYIKSIEKAKLGLYSYPVLMAADILLYNADSVPVGDDQRQHLELARDIAGAFNRNYDEEFFTIPEPMIIKTAARVMSLRDGTKKMSKSDPSDNSRINLNDSAELIEKKIKKATTDAIEGISYEPEARPEVANLLRIYSAFEGCAPEAAAEKFSDYNFGKFKPMLAEYLSAKISPISTEFEKLIADKAYLDEVLKDGAARANVIAEANIAKIKNIVGFV